MPDPKFIDQYVFEDIMYEAGADEVNDTYSGRAMYGESCIAASGGNISLVRVGLQIGLNTDLDESTKVRLVRAAHTDSMGLGVVVYFPDWQFDDDE